MTPNRVADSFGELAPEFLPKFLLPLVALAVEGWDDLEIEADDLADALQAGFEEVGGDLDGSELARVGSAVPQEELVGAYWLGLHIISIFRVPRPEYL